MTNAALGEVEPVSCAFVLSVGGTQVLYGTNRFDSDLLVPFQKSDVVCGDDDFFGPRSSTSVVARRLDILGFTLPAAETAYARGLRTYKEKFPGYPWPPNLAAWQRGVSSQAARIEALGPYQPVDDQLFVWEETLLGFPGGSLWIVVRALVDALGPDDSVSLDLTELAAGGYLEEGADLWDEFERTPVVVLTEGKSDARLLRLALDTLLPDYADFIRFLDYDFARAAGGVGEVVRFVKMFAGSGIQNRIVALFDNDTAGRQALGDLGPLPGNVFPMCLPSVDRFKNYPALGPDGPGMSDVDGRACSLELYLGREALTDTTGNLRPVRWTAFNEKLGRYQGEIPGKGDVQAKFEEILRVIAASPEQRSKYDLAGVEMVFGAMFDALASR